MDDGHTAMTEPLTLTIDDILKKLPEGVVGIEARDLVRRAFLFAEDAHQGQLRKSGEPYLQHCLHVAYLLADLGVHPVVVAAGLLHDVLEDCKDKASLELLRQSFGAEVASLVDGVTKLEDVERFRQQSDDQSRDQQESESLRKLFIAMADNPWVMFIKLADRLHNMRTLKPLSRERQVAMATETLEIFVPLANRLGIWQWKADLEDLSLRYLNPTMYKEIADLLEARKPEREQRVARHVALLRQALEREGIRAEIKGRPKHIYSIYRKMRRKNVPFSQIYDVEGIRVIVETIPQCYQVLGIVHGLWAPIPREFDDYIAHPKPNLYRSLHTAVVADDEQAFEIQIRTREMDQDAEYGLAAHWRYKEQAPQSRELDQQVTWMRQAVQELRQEAESAQSFIEQMKTDLFQDRVYAFTPKGRVIELPLGATPLDFAYAIHSEVGHRCRGARANGLWVPLNYQIQTGDRVEIITGKQAAPSQDWLNEELGFIKTHRARAKIQQWFRRQDREENIARGRETVERELRRLGLDLTVEDVAELFERRFPREEEFLAAVGVGDVTNEHIIAKLEDYARRKAEEEAELPEESEIPPPPPVSAPGKVNIQGTGGMLTHVARCCNPLPGEDIVGYVTRGRGITIHRRDCPNMLRISREEHERVIEVEWGQQEHTFAAQVLIMAYDRHRLLHDISGVVANESLNMSAVSTGKRDRYNIIPIYITLEVPNLAKLNRILGKIEQIPNVIEARRVS